MCCPEEAIHPIDKNMALVCLLLNILVMPGLGTMIHACMGQNAGAGICYGLLQFFLAPVFLIGYIWGIVYGVKIFQKASLHNGDGYHKTHGTQQ